MTDGRKMTLAGRRWLYFGGDLIASVCAGALVAVAAGGIVPAGWPPWSAMLAGMAAGMILSVPCWLAAGLLLGMIEPMLQIMLVGMVAGMVATMVDPPHAGLGLWALGVLGAQCGLGTGLVVAGADFVLRRGGQSG